MNQFLAPTNIPDKHNSIHANVIGIKSCGSSLKQTLKQLNDSLGKVILPAWLDTFMHTHWCSLFAQAAINLHARGYGSTGGRNQRLNVRKSSLK